MHETPLNISIGTLISGSYKPQSQDFPAWAEANFTHTRGVVLRTPLLPNRDKHFINCETYTRTCEGTDSFLELYQSSDSGYRQGRRPVRYDELQTEYY